ncbi:MAG: histone deacetylase [Spirochaetota bacterium]
MVLHYPDGIDLTEYGILIPVAPDRTAQVLAALRADPRLGPRESEWLLGPDGSEITREDLLRVHAPEYVGRGFGDGVEGLMLEVFELVDADGSYHRYDPDTARRSLAELFADWKRWMAGTYQCGSEALRHGFCFYLGGGAHHGHYDFGHGFCVFNDIVTAIRRHQAEGSVRTAWVIDVDAHKGDGTAALTADDETIVTLSIHMGRSWPLDLPDRRPDGSPTPWFIPSTVEIPIEPGGEGEYLRRLDEGLALLDAYPRPDLVYVVDGADPYEHDELPSTADLRLSLDALMLRDQRVAAFLDERELPQAWLMSGGYGVRAWEPFAQFLRWRLAGG